jgi:tRNA A22 N-methylase
VRQYHLQVSDLIRDEYNIYQVLGVDYNNYCKPSEVAVRCIRGPHVGKARNVQYSTVMKMFAEKQLSLVEKGSESV